MTDVPSLSLEDGFKIPQLGLGVWQIPDCGFREVPDSDYGKSRTRISVSRGQGFQ